MTLRLGNKKVCPTKIIKKEIKIYLYPNFTKSGTVVDNGGVVKTSDATGYLTSTVATPASGTYEINVNFTTPENSITGDSPLIQVNNGDVFVNSNMRLCSWTGSAWAGGSTTLEYDKNYSFKFIRSDSGSTIYLKEGLPSDNIIDYTQEYTIANYSDNSNIIFLKYGTQQYWQGTIDMKYCNLKRNGTILWEGCTKTIIN